MLECIILYHNVLTVLTKIRLCRLAVSALHMLIGILKHSGITLSHVKSDLYILYTQAGKPTTS